MSQRERVERARPSIERREQLISSRLLEALSFATEPVTVRRVRFDLMSVEQLAAVLRTRPELAKALLLRCHHASRALKNDLGIDVNLYEASFSADESLRVAELLLGLLPDSLELSELVALDSYAFADKELRSESGRWEKSVLSALNNLAAAHRFDKAKPAGFELDCAAFDLRSGELAGAVDVKRINGVSRDADNRSRDIRDLARKFRAYRPDLRMVAVVYYPDESAHTEIRRRLTAGTDVHEVLFASEERRSLESAALAALEALGLPAVRASDYRPARPAQAAATLF